MQALESGKAQKKIGNYAYCNNFREFAQLLSLDFEFINNTNCRAVFIV
jgi:hypothetical protein